jgi:hypothetical protein
MANDLLSIGDYSRYGRQMILDGFGLPGKFAAIQVGPAESCVRLLDV